MIDDQIDELARNMVGRSFGSVEVIDATGRLDTFIQARKLRYLADYDHLAVMTKADVVKQIEAVDTVLQMLGALSPRTSFAASRAAGPLESSPR